MLPRNPAGRRPTADPVTEYAHWKQQIEELKTQAERAAECLTTPGPSTILETVPSKHRDNARLADWTANATA